VRIPEGVEAQALLPNGVSKELTSGVHSVQW